MSHNDNYVNFYSHPKLLLWRLTLPRSSFTISILSKEPDMSEKNTAKDTASPRCRNACAGQRSGKTVVPDRETLLDKAAVAEQGLQRKPLSVQGIRLNKTIAQAGYCSRRKADELIFSGQVLVNGCVEQNPPGTCCLTTLSQSTDILFPLLRNFAIFCCTSLCRQSAQ